MSETISERARNVVDTLIVTDGEDKGRYTIEIAYELADIENHIRNHANKFDDEEPQRAHRSLIAGEATERVIMKPLIMEDKASGIDTESEEYYLNLRRRISNYDMNEAFRAAEERYNEIIQ